MTDILKRGVGLLVLAVLSLSAHAQLYIRGELLTAAGGKPIPFANIGIAHQNLGTISNADGSFELRLDSAFTQEAITFSALGFEKKSVAVQQLQKAGYTRITLEERQQVLEAVTIQSDIEKLKGIRVRELGNSVHTAGTIRLDTARAGGAVALLISSNATSPAYLEKARLYITQNSADTFRVRVRLYKKEAASGLPGEDLLHKSVVVASSLRKGWLEVDLAYYNLLLPDQEFFLAFEWIMEKEDRARLAGELLAYLAERPESLVSQQYEVEGKQVTDTKIIGFGGGTWFGTTYTSRVVAKSTCYYRLSSLGEWKRSPAILTAGVSVVVEK